MQTYSAVTSLMRNKKYLLFVSGAIHFTMLAIIIWKSSPWITGDSGRYLVLATSLTSGEGFGIATINGFEPEGMRAPGYSIFILIVRSVAGNSDFSIILFQSLMYLALIWLVWKICRQIFNDECAMIFLLISALYPFLMYSAGQISPEIPTAFLLASAVWLLLKPSFGRVLGAAALIAVAAYFRPNLIFLDAVLLTALFIKNIRDWRKPLLVLVTTIIIVAPFAARNYIVFGKSTPLPVIRGTGNSLMLTYWMTKISINSLVKYGMYGEVTPEVKDSGMVEQIAEINRKVGVPENTLFVTLESYPTNETKMKADELLGEYAVRNIAASPFAYLKTVAKNSVRMWFTSELPDEYSLKLKLALWINGIAFALLGACGVVMAFLKRNENNRLIITFLSGVFLYFIATLSWLHTEARYTITARAFLLMFAAYAIYEFYKFGKTFVWKNNY